MLDGGHGFTPYALHPMSPMNFGAPSPNISMNMPPMMMPMLGYGVRPIQLNPNAMREASATLGNAEPIPAPNYGGLPPMYTSPLGNGMMVPPLPNANMPGNVNNSTTPFVATQPSVATSSLPPGKMKKPLGRPRKYPPPEPPGMRIHTFAAIETTGKRVPAQKPKLRSRLKPPKQSPSAWQIFFSEELQKIKATSPEERLNVAHIAKDAGQRYADLPDWKRQEYQQRSQEAKEQYEKELAEWRSKLTPDDIKQENLFRSAQRKMGKSRRGNLKDPNAPKKPLSAYFLFLRTIRMDPVLCQEVLEGEHETTKQSVLAAAKWRTMSDTEKQPFLEQAERDKAEYERLRREYEASHGAADGCTAAHEAADGESGPPELPSGDAASPASSAPVK
ncbi:hypothetical protein MBRA1_001984 [Malassezia brasiliensis]|uniref:HMG box domain-containing protein n=1 Tax=Malassezia brasiliensis TaxID=1821822 RepID=A0AAF0DTV9_9BASI|nr:hypothetical protein MBRA1_001984 [Malassezia brasiliensis]